MNTREVTTDNVCVLCDDVFTYVAFIPFGVMYDDDDVVCGASAFDKNDTHFFLFYCNCSLLLTKQEELLPRH